MVAPNSGAARVPLAFSNETSTPDHGTQGPRVKYEHFCAAHFKAYDLTARPVHTDAQEAGQSSASAPPPMPVLKGLPLCFIDEQELRQPSNTKLRRVIRSHARRDTDLKRKQLNAALKSNLETPRSILGKLTPASLAAERPKLSRAKTESSGLGTGFQHGRSVSYSEAALGPLTTPSGKNTLPVPMPICLLQLAFVVTFPYKK